MKKIIIFTIIFLLLFSCSKENEIEILDIIKKAEPINLENNIDNLQFIEIINNLNIEEKKVLTQNCEYIDNKDDNLKKIKTNDLFILINYCNVLNNKNNSSGLIEQRKKRDKILEKYIK